MPVEVDTCRKILSDYLNLDGNEKLCIIYEKETEEIFNILGQVATDLNISVDRMCLSKEERRMIKTIGDIPSELVRAILNSDAVLTAVSSFSEETPFRKSVISYSVNAKKKVAHLPGVNLQDLIDGINIDFDEMCDIGKKVESRLDSVKDNIKIITEYGDREEILTVNYSSGYVPVRKCMGIIKEGGLGNLPPGEIYVVPKFESAKGRIIIDGSIDGHIVNSPLTLEFRHGGLVCIEPTGAEIGKIILKRGMKMEKEFGDLKWRHLSELGIGINKGLSIRGKSTTDEKVYGTAHIALGSNVEFGGIVESKIHEDLVFQKPTIILDNRVTLMDHGEIV